MIFGVIIYLLAATTLEASRGCKKMGGGFFYAFGNLLLVYIFCGLKDCELLVDKIISYLLFIDQLFVSKGIRQ